jgi:hypothetical protein
MTSVIAMVTYRAGGTDMQIREIDGKSLASLSANEVRERAASERELTVLVTEATSLDLCLLNVLSPQAHAFSGVRPYDAERNARQRFFALVRGIGQESIRDWLRRSRVRLSSDSCKMLFGPLADAMNAGKELSLDCKWIDQLESRLFGLWCTSDQVSWYLDRYSAMEKSLGRSAFIEFREATSTELPLSNSLISMTALVGPSAQPNSSLGARREALAESIEWLRASTASEQALSRAILEVPAQIFIHGAINLSRRLIHFADDDTLAMQSRTLRLKFVELLGLPQFATSLRALTGPEYVKHDGLDDPIVPEARRVYDGLCDRFPFVLQTQKVAAHAVERTHT